MSNPFRNTEVRATTEVSGRGGQSTPPLSVNTRLPSIQKHVNFASPPAIGISPASSYPSSPESTRQSPGFAYAHASLPETGGYGQALINDPFQEEQLDDEDDRAIAQAVQNARTNSEAMIAGGQATTANQANVRDTLSRFSSTGRRPAKKVEEEAAKKPAMDVNAFARLLLTGDSGASATGPSSGAHDGSASSTDTSSTQPSTLESTPRATEATPRSSSEQERQAPSTVLVTKEVKRPPPPPKPRSSKSESQTDRRADSNATQQFNEFSGEYVQVVRPGRSGSIEGEDGRQSSSAKKPPPPPLARRKSQKSASSSSSRPEMTRSVSSRQSINSESDEPPSPSPALESVNRIAPPPRPPPSRQPNPQYGRRPSMDLPATHEEDEDEASDTARRPSTSSSKRLSQSQSTVPPPPVPPPRKGRGASGRSSVDSQHRPSLASLGLSAGSARSSSEFSRPPGNESRNVSGASNAADILADLEALRREVDAARASAGR